MRRKNLRLLVLAGLSLMAACTQSYRDDDSGSDWSCRHYSYQSCPSRYGSGGGDNGTIKTAQWAKTSSGSYNSYFNTVTADVSNNIYAAGSVEDTTAYSFGTGINVTGSGASTNAVLVKYDVNGNAQWARTPSSAANTGSNFKAVATDSSGNVYAAGIQENGTFTYGTGVTATGPGTSSYPVLVKFNSSGSALWARTISSGTDGEFRAIAIDSAGNVYAAGNQAANASYTYGTGVISNPPATGTRHAVLVKYDASGTALWARTIASSTNRSEFLSVAIDSAGNVYAAGSQYGTALVSYGGGVTATGVNAGLNGVLVKYDASGNPLWARTATSGGSYSNFLGVGVDSNANVYLAGYQNGNSAFSYGNGVTATSANSGGGGILLKYASDGTPQWAKMAASASQLYAFSTLSVLASGELYVGGYQSGNGSFNYGNGVTVQGAAAADNVFLIKYDANGTPLWAKSTISANNGSTFYALFAKGNGLIVGCGFQYGDEAIEYLPGVEATGSVYGVATATSMIVRYQ